MAKTRVRRTAKIATTLYSSLRKANAPSRTASWISFMRSLPALWRRIHAAMKPETTSAKTPATGARVRRVVESTKMDHPAGSGEPRDGAPCRDPFLGFSGDFAGLGTGARIGAEVELGSGAQTRWLRSPFP